MPWLWLIVGGLFEVGFTTSLRFVDGFRNLPWTLAFLVSVAISMGLLELASRSIPMGTAYAVWGGIGAVGTVVVGILWFHEPSSTVRVLLILAIVAAIAALEANRLGPSFEPSGHGIVARAQHEKRDRRLICCANHGGDDGGPVRPAQPRRKTQTCPDRSVIDVPPASTAIAAAAACLRRRS